MLTSREGRMTPVSIRVLFRKVYKRVPACTLHHWSAFSVLVQSPENTEYRNRGNVLVQVRTFVCRKLHFTLHYKVTFFTFSFYSLEN